MTAAMGTCSRPTVVRVNSPAASPAAAAPRIALSSDSGHGDMFDAYCAAVGLSPEAHTAGREVLAAAMEEAASGTDRWATSGV
eukprot:5192062-Pyramimonas_sp.AAC.1